MFIFGFYENAFHLRLDPSSSGNGYFGLTSNTTQRPNDFVGLAKHFSVSCCGEHDPSPRTVGKLYIDGKLLRWPRVLSHGVPIR